MHHLQNDYNYTAEQEELFNKISELPDLNPDFKTLIKQLVNRIEKLHVWTDKEMGELEDFLYFIAET